MWAGEVGWAGSGHGQCPQAGRQGASPWQGSMLGHPPGRTTDSLPPVTPQLLGTLPVVGERRVLHGVECSFLSAILRKGGCGL